MLRLVGFFVVVLVLMAVLRQLPWIGPFFQGFLAFWIVAIVASIALARLSAAMTRRRRLGGEIRALGHVESPHNQGKLGTLLALHGRHAAAIPPLERAAEGEPQTAEWHYRLGIARLRLGRTPQAIAALARAAEIDEEHAYGGVQLHLAQAWLAAGEPEKALEAVERFDRNHGPNPQSAYHRGVALRRMGRKDEARASFRQVAELYYGAARFQRQQHRGWVWKSLLARAQS